MNDLHHYEVSITYEDGETFAATVEAENSTRAFSLALRMASPFGSFQAPVKHWDSVIAELEEV